MFGFGKKQDGNLEKDVADLKRLVSMHERRLYRYEEHVTPSCLPQERTFHYWPAAYAALMGPLPDHQWSEWEPSGDKQTRACKTCKYVQRRMIGEL